MAARFHCDNVTAFCCEHSAAATSSAHIALISDTALLSAVSVFVCAQILRLTMPCICS